MITKRQLIGWLDRIAYAFQNLPAGHDGMGVKTISIEGMAAFQRDVKEFRALFMNFVWAVKDESDPEEWVAKMETQVEQIKKGLR